MHVDFNKKGKGNKFTFFANPRGWLVQWGLSFEEVREEKIFLPSFLNCVKYNEQREPDKRGGPVETTLRQESLTYDQPHLHPMQ